MRVPAIAARFLLEVLGVVLIVVTAARTLRTGLLLLDNPEGESRFFAVRAGADGPAREGWLLSFRGESGAWLALAEGSVAVAGLLLLFAPWTPARRAGGAVAVAWAGLWSLNACAAWARSGSGALAPWAAGAVAGTVGAGLLAARAWRRDPARANARTAPLDVMKP